MSDEKIYFDFYGIILKVESNDKESASFISSDFSYFLLKSSSENIEPHITVSVFLSNPPYNLIPEGTLAAYHTKNSVVYRSGSIQFYDSFGKALVIYDYRHETAEIYSLDRDILYENTYLMIMSRVGDLLDRKGLHRIHAMGVVYNGNTILCLLPMGGGKTTLTLSLLEKRGFSLLSEEVPLISSNGLLYPFPIRMGVIEGTPLSIPEEFLKPFKRTHYEPKTLIDIQYFKDQIANVAKPGLIFVGKRIYSTNPKITKTSSIKCFLSLFRYCVMANGIPQLLEYVLRIDILTMARQLPIFFSRLIACLVLVYKSESYEIHLGYDREANASVLTEFISNKFRDTN